MTGPALFLAFTPYHALLSYALASSEAPGRSWLVVVSDFPNAEEFTAALRDSSESPFQRVLHLENGRHGAGGPRRRRQRRSIRFLRDLIEERSFDRLFVANDGRPEALAALDALRRGGGGAAIYMEDGMALYADHVLERPWPSRLAARLYWGRSWEHVGVLGTSSSITELRGLFPEHRRRELASLPAAPIPREPLRRLAEEAGTWLRFLSKDELERHLQTQVVLVVTHSSFARAIPGYMEGLSSVARAATERGLRVALKYHPLDRTPLRPRTDGAVEVLPANVPLELFFFAARKKLRIVVGDISTALVSARWALPEAEIHSAAAGVGWSDPALLEVLSDIGLTMHSSWSAIAANLQQSTRYVDP